MLENLAGVDTCVITTQAESNPSVGAAPPLPEPAVPPQDSYTDTQATPAAGGDEPSGPNKPIPDFPKSFCGKLRAYNKHYLQDKNYRRSLLCLLAGQLGDGAVLAASARVGALVGLAGPVLKNPWMLTAVAPAQSLLTQVGDLFVAQDRDTARHTFKYHTKSPASHVAYRAQHANRVGHTAWVDAACGVAWVGILVGGMALGVPAWPVAVALGALTIIYACSRSQRFGAWDNLRFTLQTNDTSTRNIGSVASTMERMLGTLATLAGAALVTGLEVALGPGMVVVTVAVALAVGCTVGAAGKVAFVWHMRTIPAPRS